MLVKFEVYNDGEYWCARGMGIDIFTQGKTLDDVMTHMKEAVEVHFDEALTSGEEITILSISETEVRPVAKAPGH
jgi:predicted RNase H-like HicB family nuclease